MATRLTCSYQASAVGTRPTLDQCDPPASERRFQPSTARMPEDWGGPALSLRPGNDKSLRLAFPCENQLVRLSASLMASNAFTTRRRQTGTARWCSCKLDLRDASGTTCLQHFS